MEHKYARMTKTPLVQAGVEEDGTPILVDDPFEQTLEVIGCMNCDMGLEEASQSDCIGVPLERLLEDE